MDDSLLYALRLAGGWGRSRRSLVLGKSRRQRHDIDKALARLEARGEARCVYVRKHGRTGSGLETWYAVDPEDVGPPKAGSTVTAILCALPQAGAAGMTRTEIHALFKRNRCSADIQLALDMIAAAGKARSVITPKPAGTRGGRATETWFAIEEFASNRPIQL